MTVRELIGNLILMPQDAKVFVDCSTDYPECGEVTVCQQWKDVDKEHLNYGWSAPRDNDVFLN